VTFLDTVSDFITNLTRTGFDFGGITPYVLLFLRVGVYTIITIVGVLVYYKFFHQYKARVTVLRGSYGKVNDVVQDKAKISTDQQGKTKMTLWKLRLGKTAYSCPVPSGSYRQKVGKKDHYFLFLDDNQQLHPVQVGMKERIASLISKKARESVALINQKNEELLSGKLRPVEMSDIDEELQPFIKPMPQERNVWIRQESDLINQKREKKKRWETLAMPTAIITGFIILFLITFFLTKEIGASSSAMVSAIEGYRTACLG